MTSHGGAMSTNERIAFTRPYLTGREHEYLTQALASGFHGGDGPFTKRATDLLSPLVGGGECLITTSCTHALEMAAILLELDEGDEVIMPSFTFVSTANAVVLRGAVPVFVDCRPDTLNLDERLVEQAVTERTKAILVVHYGGVACDMAAIGAVAERHGLTVIEDNAHGLGASYRGEPLGSFGALATQSFHATKNVSCGEGGALVINDPALADRAEIVREKGTNRSQFMRGQIDKYRWVDAGSSYLPADLLAAVLTAQLETFGDIQTRRHAVWDRYDEELADWRTAHDVQCQTVPADRTHPAHLFYLLLPTPDDQGRFLKHLAQQDIVGTFHYVPLDTAPYAQGHTRTGPGGCPVTADISSRLVRLPLHAALTTHEVDRVIAAVTEFAL